MDIKNNNNLVIRGVGDVLVDREDPAFIFDLARPVLMEAGITFGNCESTYSEIGSRNPWPNSGSACCKLPIPERHI